MQSNSKASKANDPSSLPLVLLGTSVLLFGFMGFNAGSVVYMDTVDDAKLASLSVVNTIISAAGGSLSVSMVIRITKHSWNLQQSCNGLLAGMVSICASANQVKPWAAIVIGHQSYTSHIWVFCN
eukprot:m.120838 g.120838  ORF g.120838 m.120838 type:complete len:125 (+) comp14372_c0_seq6:1083-1457(+)